jgi:hypothetical protein
MPAAASSVDVAAIGYPTVRQAFNEVLRQCVARLGKADLDMAWDILGVDHPTSFEPRSPELDVHVLVQDTALYSRPGEAIARQRRKRPIDRIVRKLPAADALNAYVLGRLTSAFFSVFEVAEVSKEGRVVLRDLLDEGRRIQVLDNSLAPRSQPGMLVAGRFVDLGPWHIAFGIVVALRRSEATAILVALASRGAAKDRRDDLHELVYGCRLHDDDIVMEAIMPVIAALAVAVDSGLLPMADLTAGLGAMTGAARPMAAE